MNTINTRQKGSPIPPPASTNLRDIYYILFRHKWLIILLTALGMVSSYGVYSLWSFPYISEAKVYIRYIQDTVASSEMDPANMRMTTPDNSGADVLNTELQILTSTDLALQIATNLGPATILGKPSESNNVIGAATYINEHLKAGVSNRSAVIILDFTSVSPTLPQSVLREIIAAYQNRYVEIHMTPGFTEEALGKQTDMAKDQLGRTQNRLKDLKIKLGITDLSDAAKNAQEQLAKTDDSIFLKNWELARVEADIKELQARIPKAATNVSATHDSSNVTSTAPAPPTAEVVAKYQKLKGILNDRQAEEDIWTRQFKGGSFPIVKNAQAQREAAEADVKKFEAENPGLFALKINVAGSPAVPLGVDPHEALQDAEKKRRILLAEYGYLTNQLAVVKNNVAGLDDSEYTIMQALTEMQDAQKKYDSLLNATERARMYDAMGNKISGIKVVEQPTAPGRDVRKVLKATGGVLGFFLALAFGLPFLIEMVLDQSCKHPVDVQARIGAPFFITIPRTNGHGKLAALKRAKQVPLLAVNGSATPAPKAEAQSVALPANGQMAPWDQRHELRPFFETLRDRLMTYFEMINLTHKPKLVAVTSCGPGAGVTTTAAGLASSLSEIGEGNVLLVNMNVGDGEAHHFYKGKLNCGIEEVLGREKRDQAQVQNNLFVVKETESNDNLPRVLPKRFSHLLPMLKASDFDYIIFDMPPVSEISITPRLARFMDMVLLVIESEKTSRDAATRVASLLGDTKTNVGLVLNKNRSYLPKRLEHSL